jgi:hypothetical protein
MSVYGTEGELRIEEVVETDRRICRPCWFKLPLRLRRRWWRETDYGAREPSPELIEANVLPFYG